MSLYEPSVNPIVNEPVPNQTIRPSDAREAAQWVAEYLNAERDQYREERPEAFTVEKEWEEYFRDNPNFEVVDGVRVCVVETTVRERLTVYFAGKSETTETVTQDVAVDADNVLVCQPKE